MAGRMTVVQGYSVNWVQVMWCRWAIVFPPLEFCVCVRQAILENFRCFVYIFGLLVPPGSLYIHITFATLSLPLPSFLSLLLPSPPPLFASWHWLLCYLYLFLAHILFQLPTSSTLTSFEWFLLQGIAIGSNSGSSDQFFLRQSSFIFHFEFTDWVISHSSCGIWANISFWVLTRRLKFDSFSSYSGKCWNKIVRGLLGLAHWLQG